MCNFAELSVEERRKLAIKVRGNYTGKCLYRYQDTEIHAHGYEFDMMPASYSLRYEGALVYCATNLTDLLDTENYSDRPINEDEIDTLRQVISINENEFLFQDNW